MNVESITARLAVRCGPEVAEWCAAVPALSARLAARWDLTVGDLIDDGGSLVALRCTWRDGSPVILKLTPDRGFLASQAEMLRSLGARAGWWRSTRRRAWATRASTPWTTWSTPAGKEGVEARCAAVARACDLDVERLLEWSRVNATLAVIGHLTWGGSEDVIRELLGFAR
ncbi:hypothetical protein ACQPW3_37215 [Actinosynnema sp. CA-248983]